MLKQSTKDWFWDGGLGDLILVGLGLIVIILMIIDMCN